MSGRDDVPTFVSSHMRELLREGMCVPVVRPRDPLIASHPIFISLMSLLRHLGAAKSNLNLTTSLRITDNSPLVEGTHRNFSLDIWNSCSHQRLLFLNRSNRSNRSNRTHNVRAPFIGKCILSVNSSSSLTRLSTQTFTYLQLQSLFPRIGGISDLQF